MYEDPEETPSEDAADPIQQADEKVNEFRMIAELAAVFEGPRKFGAKVLHDLDETLARRIQKSVANLEKKRVKETALLPDGESADELLNVPAIDALSTNDYHVFRDEADVMIARWISGDQVDSFYERIQAHFDAQLNHYREDERQQHAWKQDESIDKRLNALQSVELKMAERYLRPIIKEHKLFVLSTQTIDDINISYLTETLMTVPADELIGEAHAPLDTATDAERPWFFKLFALRGMRDSVEQMLFFTFLQKVEDSW